MTCCNVIIPNNKISLCILPIAECSGDPEHFHILVISWQFEHSWANNWQGMNNSHRTLKLWFNEEKLFHLIFTTYQNYPVALNFRRSMSFTDTEMNVLVIKIHFNVVQYKAGWKTCIQLHAKYLRCEFLLFFHFRFQTFNLTQGLFKWMCGVLSLFYLVKSHVILIGFTLLFFVWIPIPIICFNLDIIV